MWAPGVKVDVVAAPLPGLGHRQPTEADEAGGAGVTWPGLIGGRFGTGTRRVRWGIGAYVGLALYGDASLAVRLAQVGRLHVALAAEGGAGAAVLAAESTLEDMLGKESLGGSFAWWRARPLMSWGPRGDVLAGGLVVTVGGIYGELAGVREVGASLGLLELGRLVERDVTIDDNEGQSSRASYRQVDVARGSGGGADLYVLWHGDDHRPAILLAFSGYFAGWRR